MIHVWSGSGAEPLTPLLGALCSVAPARLTNFRPPCPTPALCPALASLPYTCLPARHTPAVVTGDVYCPVDAGALAGGAHVSLITQPLNSIQSRVAALHNLGASNMPMTPERS